MHCFLGQKFSSSHVEQAVPDMQSTLIVIVPGMLVNICCLLFTARYFSYRHEGQCWERAESLPSASATASARFIHQSDLAIHMVTP